MHCGVARGVRSADHLAASVHRRRRRLTVPPRVPRSTIPPFCVHENACSTRRRSRCCSRRPPGRVVHRGGVAAGAAERAEVGHRHRRRFAVVADAVRVATSAPSAARAATIVVRVILPPFSPAWESEDVLEYATVSAFGSHRLSRRSGTMRARCLPVNIECIPSLAAVSSKGAGRR